MTHEERYARRIEMAQRLVDGEVVESVASQYDVAVATVLAAAKEFLKPPKKEYFRKIWEFRLGVLNRLGVATETQEAKRFIVTPAKSVWDCVNWECQDSEISRVMRVSRERVRQIRRRRGEKESVVKWRQGPSKQFSAWVQARFDSLHGQTIPTILSKYDKPIHPRTAESILHECGIRLGAATRTNKYRALPWDKLDWRLSNAALYRIWGCVGNCQSISHHRSKWQIGPATLVEGPDADAAIALEQAKAEAWRQTPEGKASYAAWMAYASPKIFPTLAG